MAQWNGLTGSENPRTLMGPLETAELLLLGGLFPVAAF